MKDEKKNLIEVIFKIIGGIGALVIFWSGMHQFNENQRHTFRFEIYQYESAAIKNLVKQASILCAYDKESPEFSVAHKEIKRMLVADLAFIQDDSLRILVRDLDEYTERFKERMETERNVCILSERISLRCREIMVSLKKYMDF